MEHSEVRVFDWRHNLKSIAFYIWIDTLPYNYNLVEIIDLMLRATYFPVRLIIIFDEKNSIFL